MAFFGLFGSVNDKDKTTVVLPGNLLFFNDVVPLPVKIRKMPGSGMKEMHDLLITVMSEIQIPDNRGDSKFVRTDHKADDNRIEPVKGSAP